jgi:F-type H+-transporting ATPase subunit delta
VKGLDAVANVYAESLLEIAFSKGVPGEVLQDVEEIGRVLKGDRVLAFFVTPNIRNADKCQVIDRAFGGRVAEVVQNFLKVTIDKGRAALLPEIVRAFVAGYHERQGEAVATVTTAQPLDDDERDRLRSTLKSRFQMQGYNDLILEERVDQKLLGGVVVRTGDSVFDASLRSRLSALGERLRGSRLKNEDVYEN